MEILDKLCCSLNHSQGTVPDRHTGGITKFSAKVNLRKILKVNHFSLGFSMDERCNKIKNSHRVSPEFSYFYRVSSVFPRSEPKISNKTL